MTFAAKLTVSFAYTDCDLTITRTAETVLALTHLVCTILAHLQPVGPLVLHFQNRYSYRYWPALYISNSVYNSLPVKILYALTDLLFSYFGIICSLYAILATASYLGLAHIWTVKLNECIKYGLSFNVGIKVYKEQLVLNKIANSVLANKLIPTFMLGGGFVLGQIVVTLIKSYHSQSVTILTNFVVGLFLLVWAFQFVIDVGGQCWEVSVKIKRNFFVVMNKVEKFRFKMESKTVNACLEVRIYMRSDFYFKSTTYFAYLETVLSNAITVVLATSM